MKKHLVNLKKIINNIIPNYAIIPLLLCVILNFTIYSGVRLFYRNRVFHDLTSTFDDKIPVIPVFIIIYLGSYIYWTVNYIIISRQSKVVCYRFVAADIIGKIICGIVYISFPTTNIRPDVHVNGLFTYLLNFLYNADAANNLFPSIHCMVSWYCFSGIKNCKNISFWHKMVSLIMTILICVSTLTTKQHVLVDVFSGIFIAELTLQLAFKLQMSNSYKYINQEV